MGSELRGLVNYPVQTVFSQIAIGRNGGSGGARGEDKHSGTNVVNNMEEKIMSAAIQWQRSSKR